MLEQLLSGIRSFFLPYSRTTNPEERRQLVRVRSHIPVQVKVDGRLQKAVVVDLGVQGLRLRSAFSLSSYRYVAVLYTDSEVKNPVVRCRVAWSRRLKGEQSYSSGLVYDDSTENMRSSWVAALLRELGLDESSIHERREFIRAFGQVPVSLGKEGPKVDPINLGVGGLLVHSKQILRSGQTFQVEVGPFGSQPVLAGLPAEVVKCSADENGYLVALRFINLDAAQVRGLGGYVLAILRESSA